MNPLTEKQIRSAFCNASRREATQANLPDLAAVDWAGLDYLGWRDAKRPLLGYFVIEVASTGPEPAAAAILLRSAPAEGRKRKTVCALCEDVVETDDVTLYVARRAGASGRNGNSVGTLICTDFRCSQNVRRAPRPAELLGDSEHERHLVTQRRVAGLQQRATAFAMRVLHTHG